jgi:hypothetical protein
MGKQTYKLIDFEDKLTYFEVLNDGDNMKLLKKDIKKFMEAKAAENSYSSSKPAKFVLESDYYLYDSSSIREIKLNKKALLVELDDKKSDVTKFIKLNKLKLKSEDEVVKLIAYYNSL